MNKRLTQTEFIERIKKISPNIEILSDYCGQKGYIKCRCKKCGREWEEVTEILNKTIYE